MHEGTAILIALAALASAGCGEASGPLGETQGKGGSTAGSSDTLREERVTWDQHGQIDPRWGLAGNWTAYYDCDTPRPPVGEFPCTLPDPELGWTTSIERVCMKGTVQKVELRPDMTLAFDLQWGTSMALELHDSNEALIPFEPYDATAHGISGFMFDITGRTSEAPVTPPTLRVGLKTASAEFTHYITIILPSVDQRAMFSEVEQGAWVMVPNAFDPRAIMLVQFDVYSNNQAPKDYDFCVSNFRVLCDGRCIP